MEEKRKMMDEIFENVNFVYSENIENNFRIFEEVEKYLMLFEAMDFMEDRKEDLLKMEVIRVFMNVYSNENIKDKVLCCERVLEKLRWYGTEVVKNSMEDIKEFKKFLGDMYEVYKKEVSKWE